MTDRPDDAEAESPNLEDADLSQRELLRQRQARGVPREVFDREARWPAGRKLDREPAHPERIPDDSPSEFRYSTRDEPA